MSETVKVPFERKAGEKATLLLAAAEELGLGQGVVRTGTGHFLVPAEVNEKAFGKQEVSQRNSEPDDEKPPAKKSAAKKSTTKKPQE
jgi:nucleoid-associated protein YgaU